MWLYPEVRTLGEFIEYYARHDAQRRALATATRTISYGEFDAASNRIANAILALGIGTLDSVDDRVGFMGLNSPDFYFALIGTAKTHAAFIPFNWRLSALELGQLVQDSGARMVFVERGHAYLWNAALEHVNLPPTTVWFDDEDTLEAQFVASPTTRPNLHISEESAAIQLYTSGTTGMPKGVMLSHGSFNRMRLCEHLEPAFDWQNGDIFINPLPNFHLLAIGIACQCLYNGVAIAIIRQFDPAIMCRTIQEDRPTLLTLTPTMIQMLIDHPSAETTDFSSIRLTLYSGSAITLGLIKRAVARIPGKFMQFYGSTEAGGAFSILRPEEHDLENEETLQSCGRPLPLIEFRIVDAEGNETSNGEPGELIARAPAITKGYWNQPEATAKVLKNGWYRTGDIARRDAEGLYYIVDRVKDMIVSGGENIYSAEVENALSTHPEVAQVAVIGVPDDRWGESVMACIIRREGSMIDAAALVAYARTILAAYKVPKRVVFMDSFPLVASGKVSKKDLRAAYWSNTGRNVA